MNGFRVEREDAVSLKDYFTVLRRQRWVIVATVVLVAVGAVVFSFAQTPIYEAESELAVEPIRRTQDVSLEELLSGADDAVATEQVVMTSRPVAERAAAQLGVDNVPQLLEAVRVEAVPETRVLRILATNTDPSAAAATADAFAQAYLDFRRDEAVDEVLSARANLDERAADLRTQIAELDEQLNNASVDDAPALEVQRDALQAQLSQVMASSSELGDAAEGLTGGGSVLTPAEPPTSPVAPQPLRNGVLAVVLGLFLGIGIAFLRDHIDDVVRDENDFKRATGNRPILGRIPVYQVGEGDGQRLITLVDSTALASESYRELSAGVRFLLVTHGGPVRREAPGESDRLGRSLLVASANAGEGKTASAANLAVAAARVGLRTVLVDTDLRKATVARRFGLGRTTGLSDVLLTGDPVSDHVVDVGVENLLVLPAGAVPPNPTELLASPAMRSIQDHLRTQADLVIYDSPAVLAVPDTLELGRFVDMCVLVGRAGKTGRRELSSAIERMEQVGTEIAGTVLNGIDAKSDGYYYAYYYGDRSDKDAGDEASTPTAMSRRDRRAAKKRDRRAEKRDQLRGSDRNSAAVALDDDPWRGSSTVRAVPAEEASSGARADDDDDRGTESEMLFGDHHR